MEDLTKQQIVLLTLLVSFVTSIATGIVAVSLMNQAPPAVTHTINQIVERTVQEVTPPSQNAASADTAAVTFDDQTADATAQVGESLVRIKEAHGNSDSVSGFGLIVSKDGVIVTDKSIITELANPVALFPNGEEFPIQAIQSQISGDVVFVVPLMTAEQKSSMQFIPISLASSVKLGQTILALSGKDSNTLSQGVISKVEGNISTTTSVTTISTTIPPANVLVGSPLFSITGDVIGFQTASLANTTSATFYPLSLLASTIPVLAN